MNQRIIKFRAWDKENKVMGMIKELSFGKNGDMDGIIDGIDGRVFIGKRTFVEFDEEDAQFKETIRGERTNEFIDNSVAEIVGNKYANPELLK